MCVTNFAFHMKLTQHCESTMRACVLSRSSHVLLLVTPWIGARQASLSVEFSRQKYWSGVPCSPPGDLANPGIKPFDISCIGMWVLYHQHHLGSLNQVCSNIKLKRETIKKELITKQEQSCKKKRQAVKLPGLNNRSSYHPQPRREPITDPDKRHSCGRGHREARVRATGRSTQALPSQSPAGKQPGNKRSPRELWSPLAGMVVLSPSQHGVRQSGVIRYDLIRTLHHWGSSSGGQRQTPQAELSKAKRPRSSRAPEPMLSTGSHEEKVTSRQKGPFHKEGVREGFCLLLPHKLNPGLRRHG